MSGDRLPKLQETIGYTFQNKKLLQNALTHSSYANERHWNYETNNERLEFLGDAVLEMVSSEFIFQNNPHMVEGKMTTLRASLVCEMSLATSAREIHLGEYLYLGKGEIRTGGDKRDSILSDAFEALIGAIYLDGGYSPAREFITRYVLSDIENRQLFYDSKTILQEIIQGQMHQGTDITYPVDKEEGPDHDKQFEVYCRINGTNYGRGCGRTKKAAEQRAAYETILMLREEISANGGKHVSKEH
ncbi:MAG: ribonuclease III [Lachnospiraceae bacterium]|nr:ribonuclease III [Lachnospiraceae bacterium]